MVSVPITLVLILLLRPLAYASQCSTTKICPNCLCCSQYGYCGSTSAYCGTGCLSNCNCGSQKKGKLVIYWGQNGNEGTLAATCQSKRYDIVILSFFNQWGSSRPPKINLAGHCDPAFRECVTLAAHIKICQKLSIKVLISMGGADGSYGFSSKSNTKSVASYVWNAFLAGSSSSVFRPLGATSLDGVDLDIESGPRSYYSDFVLNLRILMNTTASRKFLITGAPQCPFPDQWLGPGVGTALGTQPKGFDYIWVQFYNNRGCDYSGGTQAILQSWKQWSNWLISASKVTKLVLGIPASPSAAGTGYIPQSVVVTSILPALKKNSNYGGIMMWSVYEDIHNVANGKPYSAGIKAYL